MVSRRMIGIALACVLACGAVSHAMPLDLIQRNPDVYASDMTVHYDVGAGTFTAEGTPFLYNVPPLSFITGARSYTLTATIDASGNASNASLTVTGATTGGSGSGSDEVLLTGADLMEFGFYPDGSTGNPTFEFLFASVGGSLAPDLGGWPLGVIITATDPSNQFSGSFTVDYRTELAQSDSFGYAPEPASMSVFAAGAIALALRRARARRRTQRP